jgi:integrase
LNIHRIPTSKGIRSILTYWYQGARYRPVLGINLSIDKERKSALEVITAIHKNTAETQVPRSFPPDNSTFDAFVPTYLQYLKAKRRDSDQRNEKALTLHLIPHFGLKRLADVRIEDGLVYLEKRRAEKAAEGTIERECAVLSAVLNLAVECEVLDKNRLRRLPVPQYVKRERVAESWELQKIHQASSQEVWRVVILALQTGMRESKLIDVHEEWLIHREDGLWLAPSPGRSSHKRVAKAIPINDLARAALQCNLPRIGGRFFGRWKDANSFKHRWLETIERAGVHDLHFHDLRHTFATWLLEAGVDYIVIEKLLGHRLPGTGDLYIHDWDARLRDAVTRLAVLTEQKLREEIGVNKQKKSFQVPLEVPPSYLELIQNRVSSGKVVPRDRIELSTPAFSGLCSTN